MVVEPASIDEPKADDDWMTGWSTGTKKKSSKKDKAKDIVEVNEPTPDAALLQPESILEKSTTEEDPSWSSWGNVGKKDKKKGKKGLVDPVSLILSNDAAQFLSAQLRLATASISRKAHRSSHRNIRIRDRN